jgi:FkbM family methyltransferase
LVFADAEQRTRSARAHPEQVVSLGRLRRTVGSWDAVRRVTDNPTVGHAIAARTHGRLLRPSIAYTARELRGARRAAPYRLRSSGLVVYLRHNTTDASILDEIFLQRLYEPPAAVEGELRALARPLRIVDLGANIGLFGAFAFEHWPVARLTALEPHPANAALVRETIDANGLADKWSVIEACAWTKSERLPFAIQHYSDSRLVGPEEHEQTAASELVDAIDVFPLLSDADLVKIDIEGGEWTLLGDPRFARLRAPAVVVEYHPYLAPGADARDEATRALAQAGYAIEAIFHDPRGHGMIWGWHATHAGRRR